MANKDHLALLKKDVAAWNEWREKNPEIRPDLRLAKLSKEDLSGANLSEAYLRGATLSGADLRRADLGGANLSEADLRGVYLKEVKNLRRKQLEKAQTNEKTKLPDYL